MWWWCGGVALVCGVGDLGSSVLTWFSFCPRPLPLACSHSPWALVPLTVNTPCLHTLLAREPRCQSSSAACGKQQAFAEYLPLTLKHLGPFGGLVLEPDDLGWYTSCVLYNVCHHDQLGDGVNFIFWEEEVG